jgi:hypothetical protein
VDCRGGSNPNGLKLDGNGGNSIGVCGCGCVGSMTSQFRLDNALLIPISSALKRSRAGSPSEYGEVGVGQ